MPDSDGVSHKAAMHNFAKMTPPKYVTVANINIIDGVIRKTAQPRNERCACGSGRKYKLCCGRIFNA